MNFYKGLSISQKDLEMSPRKFDLTTFCHFICLLLWSLGPERSQKVSPLQLQELLRSQFHSSATQKQGFGLSQSHAYKT